MSINYVDWKAFLKPNKKKVLLVIVLFLMMPYPIYYWTSTLCAMPNYIRVPEGPCIPRDYIDSFIVPFAFPFAIYLEVVWGPYTDIIFYPFLILPFVSYILSCSIIFAYKKYKRINLDQKQ